MYLAHRFMETLGRYQILGDLRSGGMAQLLLARVVGPSGFERLVVIKRILPTFTADPNYVRMFLDEARTVARINHPNVVHVYELSQAGELYLVMEYLNGEDALGLMSRLSRRHELLDPFLACYIVAESARGLHAAHELRDDDETPLEIVHRDVSPGNVFVTYSGSIKLIDFGIARVADQSARTQVGVVKGKLAYMSPEQVAGKALDRRCDVWSLGVVLTELLTGQRLFGGENPLRVANQICVAPIPKPSALRPGIPRAIDRVCQRALERDRTKRYPTADALRSDLVQVIREATYEDAEHQLAALMQSLFSDRIEEKRDFLRRARMATDAGLVPTARTDQDVELSVATVAVHDAAKDLPEGERTGAITVVEMSEAQAQAQADRSGRARRLLVPSAITTLAVAALVAIGYATSQPTDSAVLSVASPEALATKVNVASSATEPLAQTASPPGSAPTSSSAPTSTSAPSSNTSAMVSSSAQKAAPRPSAGRKWPPPRKPPRPPEPAATEIPQVPL